MHLMNLNFRKILNILKNFKNIISFFHSILKISIGDRKVDIDRV